MEFCYKLALLVLYFFIFSVDGKRNRSNGRGFFLNWYGFTSSQIAQTSETLSNLRHTQCGLREIVVSFNREEMNEIGIAPNQISLSDSSDKSCYAIANETHYSLHIHLESANLCGTQASTNEISNVVMVFPPQISYDKLEETLESVDDEDAFDIEGSGLEGSGDMETRSATGAQSHVPTTADAIRLPFICMYGPAAFSTPSQPPLPRRTTTTEPPKLYYPIEPVDDNSYLLTLYKQPGFITEFRPPTPTIYKSTTLYGQIKPLAIGKKGLLWSCFLSNKQSVSVDDPPSSRFYFIDQGCATRDDVQLAPFDDASRLESRFQFNVRKKFDAFTFVHCEVEPCSWQGSSGLRKCVSQADYCQSEDEPSELHSARWHHTVKVISKPKALSNEVPAEESEPCNYQQPVCNCPVFSDELMKTDTTAAPPETRLSFVTVIIISLVSFAIGVILVGALWYVHVRTDPRRNMMPVRTDESGSQNSRTPIQCEEQGESVESHKLTSNYHT